MADVGPVNFFDTEGNKVSLDKRASHFAAAGLHPTSLCDVTHSSSGFQAAESINPASAEEDHC